MTGIRSFMGWSHIPDLETSAAASDDSYAGPKTQVPGKVSVQMPTDDWLCKNLSRLNITLVEGYPSCSSEAGGLLKANFSNQQSRKLSGTGCIRTRKPTPLLCLHGVLMPFVWAVSIAVIVESPDRPD